MMILIPSVLVFYCIKSRDKAVVAVASAGAFAGFAVCVFLALFASLHRIPEYSFSSNFAHYALKEYILPLAVIYAVFFLVTKDEFSFKTKSFFPLSAGFLSFFMPYIIIVSNDSVFSFYELFMKPSLWLSMIIIASGIVPRLFKAGAEKNYRSLSFFSVVLAFVIFFPPFLNSLWILNWMKPVFVVLSVLYILLAAAAGFFPLLKKK